jgi:hypothetical protein
LAGARHDKHVYFRREPRRQFDPRDYLDGCGTSHLTFGLMPTPTCRLQRLPGRWESDAGMDYWAAFQKCGLLAFFRAPVEK